ncbi:hypothetical protein RB2150_16167 [Rhodobacterales bacterium HTCC2150]|nr:hypothetical protein RB2150_16167 [Rhodobacterales bacterium HTCC2150] [Rhodobacteraceae bacterium HTCC2150]
MISPFDEVIPHQRQSFKGKMEKAQAQLGCRSGQRCEGWGGVTRPADNPFCCLPNYVSQINFANQVKLSLKL